jgi:NAD+ synthase (glutamine-hydrolysing)
MKALRIAMAQINCTVGDLYGNAEKIRAHIEKAKKQEVDLVTFPELSLTGYPPEDLILKRDFLKENLKHMEAIKEATSNITAVVGFVDRINRRRAANAAAVFHNRKLAGIYHKVNLPNYGVFDEMRYFVPGDIFPVFLLGGIRLGVNICEDIWFERGPAYYQALGGGAEVIVNINASPYHVGKWRARQAMLEERAAEALAIIAYNNLVGSQDELVFDGQGMIVGSDGELLARSKQFEEDLMILDLDVDKVAETRSANSAWQEERERLAKKGYRGKEILISETALPPKMKAAAVRIEPSLSYHEEIYCALKLGVYDYVRKNGFEKVVIGLSGGIDSALVATIAADSLGRENVATVFMPSPYSSKESKIDAAELSSNLGLKLKEIPITKIYESYLQTLAPEFKDLPFSVAEENLQARIRGNLLMALSNKFGWLVFTTGNKSEMAVGYATLYGDMAGGFAVIKDVPKTLVYELAKYRNSRGAVIPERIITKVPTAELRPEQKDTDSLPPYEVLDPILHAYVEEDRSPREIEEMGFPRKVVVRVIAMVDRNEYKRRQAPPGIKITPKAFGKDRRLPITNWFTKHYMSSR